ncbi:hypothetical protein CerSpe_072670 [Prunus speciosa]
MLSKVKGPDGIGWNVIFAITCWYIWNWRNKEIFNVEVDMPFNPRKTIFTAVVEWVKAANGFGEKPDRIHVFLAWEHPTIDQLKLNVDGSRRAATNIIGVGGVIRDSLGDWIAGFAVNLGQGHILEAEVWGLYFGLKLAVEKGITNLAIEMDAAIVVSLVQQINSLQCHPLVALVHSCCDLMRQIGNCHLVHIYREKNCVADYSANWSYNLDTGICFFDKAPIWVSSLLVDDLLGLARP